MSRYRSWKLCNHALVTVAKRKKKREGKTTTFPSPFAVLKCNTQCVAEDGRWKSHAGLVGPCSPLDAVLHASLGTHTHTRTHEYRLINVCSHRHRYLCIGIAGFLNALNLTTRRNCRPHARAVVAVARWPSAASPCG